MIRRKTTRYVRKVTLVTKDTDTPTPAGDRSYRTDMEGPMTSRSLTSKPDNERETFGPTPDQ